MINDNVIKKAIFAAKKSDVARAKVAAILFTDAGQIVSYTQNTRLYGTNGKFTIHAEKRLIAKCCRLNISRFHSLNVLVVRWMKGSQSLGLARPCNECSYLLSKTGFKVFYSDENGNIQKLY